MRVRVHVRVLVAVPMRVCIVICPVPAIKELARHAVWLFGLLIREHHCAYIEAASLARFGGLAQERAVLVLLLWLR